VRYYILFGLIAIAQVAFLYPHVYNHTDWNPYAVWVATFSTTTFVIYGLDKGLSKWTKTRAPEKLLHLLAMLGGFPGGWLGMIAFHHKSNILKHLNVWLVLGLSTIGHLALTHYWFFRCS
jgi:uncharacterized membrane protein YsdA (DUF1294 family)